VPPISLGRGKGGGKESAEFAQVRRANTTKAKFVTANTTKAKFVAFFTDTLILPC